MKNGGTQFHLTMLIQYVALYFYNCKKIKQLEVYLNVYFKKEVGC